jgi:SAM-dependent methyltransferase
VSDYTWKIDTELSADAVKTLLAPFRPFRIEVGFSNGFNTSAFGDQTVFATSEPLAKLRQFEKNLLITPLTRILDVGSHLGHYGHHFRKAGVAHFTGVEYDGRTHNAAKVLADIAGLQNLELLNFDFGDPAAPVPQLSPVDIVLCLSVINHIDGWQLALRRLADKTRGTLVLEYDAFDSQEGFCQFCPSDSGFNNGLHWFFAERFMDELLDAHGLIKSATTLRWRNDKILGPGRFKNVSVYARKPVAGDTSGKN